MLDEELKRFKAKAFLPVGSVPRTGLERFKNFSRNLVNFRVRIARMMLGGIGHCFQHKRTSIHAARAVRRLALHARPRLRARPMTSAIATATVKTTVADVLVQTAIEGRRLPYHLSTERFRTISVCPLCRRKRRTH